MCQRIKEGLRYHCVSELKLLWAPSFSNCKTYRFKLVNASNTMASVLVSTIDNVLFASIQKVLSEAFPDIQVIQRLSSLNLPPSYLMLPTQHEIEFVPATEVIRINGYKNYSTFTLNNRRPVTVSRNLAHFERILPETHFFRVHKSHLVNLQYVLRYRRQGGGAIQMSDDFEVPVSPNRRDLLLTRLAQIAHSYTG